MKTKPVLSGGSSFYYHCSSSIFCGSWPVSPALLPLFCWFRCCGEDDDWQALCFCFSSTLLVLFRLLLCYSGFFSDFWLPLIPLLSVRHLLFFLLLHLLPLFRSGLRSLVPGFWLLASSPSFSSVYDGFFFSGVLASPLL